MGAFDTKSMKAQIEQFENSFKKSFGDNTLRRGKKLTKYEVISTGSIELDVKTGVGGYVEGRITEIWAPPDFAKTSLAFLGAAEAQRKYRNRMVAYIDVENKVDETWAEALGVDRSAWYLYVPQSAEDVSDSIKRFLESPLFSMVIVDSVGAMMSRVEQEKQADEDVVATTARIVTRMIKHATFFASKHNQVVIILNQPRSNISRYGADITTPGGWALKHASTMKFQLRGTEKGTVTATVKGEKLPIGKEIAVKIERNKCAPAGGVARIFFKNIPTDKYGPVGIDNASEAVSLGTALDVIKRSGNSYFLSSGEKFIGQESLIQYLRKHPDEVADIRKQLLALKTSVVVEEDESYPELQPEPQPELEDEAESKVEVEAIGPPPHIPPIDPVSSPYM